MGKKGRITSASDNHGWSASFDPPIVISAGDSVGVEYREGDDGTTATRMVVVRDGQLVEDRG